MANRKLIVPVGRARKVCYLVSGLMVAASIVLLIVPGFNLGIDFESGLSQTVQLAPSGLALSWDGPGDAVLRTDGEGFCLELREGGAVRKIPLPFASHPTAGDLAAALGAVEGITVEVLDAGLATSGVITGYGFPAALGEDPFVVNFLDPGSKPVTIEQVRQSVSRLGNVKVQSVGKASDQVFQIRAKSEGKEKGDDLTGRIEEALDNAFGRDDVVVLETNFIGARFSSSLLYSSLAAVAIAVALILVYVWIRFELGYAIASVLALVHDVVCMLGFVAALRFEVSSTTIAAALTIIGYSLNNTIVILDRVRSCVRQDAASPLERIIDRSVTDSLSRTTISSVTTMIAIAPLCVFASGDIFYFAAALLFGIFVGTYSSNFIAPALLLDFSRWPALDARKIRTKKKVLSDQESAASLLGDEFAKADKAAQAAKEAAKARKLASRERRRAGAEPPEDARDGS